MDARKNGCHWIGAHHARLESEGSLIQEQVGNCSYPNENQEGDRNPQQFSTSN